MPGKEYPKTDDEPSQEQASQLAPEPNQSEEMKKLVEALIGAFSSVRDQPREETQPPVSPEAKVAVSVFNDTVAGLHFKAPAQPLKLSAQTLPSKEIKLTWTDDAKVAAEYQIKRCQGQNCADFADRVKLGSTVREFQDSGLPANTTFRYQVVAVSATGRVLSKSNIVEITTPQK